MTTERGIVLCAVGSQKFYDLCNTLIRDIKEVMPSLPIAVYTDNGPAIKNADIHLEGVHDPKKIFMAKIKACRKSPFQETIFLDVDCRVLRPIDHIFKMLQTHDMGLVFGQGRKYLWNDDWDPSKITPNLCSSTLIFSSNSKVVQLFEKWEDEYERDILFPGEGDQIYLGYLVYHDQSIRYFLLPDEYHLNTDHPSFVAGSVKILTSVICDLDPKGKYSRERLDKIMNPPGVRSRLLYFKMLMGPSWTKRTYFLPNRILVKRVDKGRENLLARSTKNILKFLRVIPTNGQN